MTVLTELKRRSRTILLPALGGCVLAYFAYHSVQGDHGLLSLVRLSKEVQKAQVALNRLQEERLLLEHRVSLLDQRSLDLDMLEERLRLDLHKLRDNEIVIFFPVQS